MTTTPRPPPREPLTPDEREMAARLARLGPHDGPSAALDARILAAAHAAAGRDTAPHRHRGRRILALPAGWLTGVGLAASLTLVLGVVWQLRPSQEVLTERSEAPLADGGFVPAAPVASGRPRVLAPAAPSTGPADEAPAARVAEPQVRERAATAKDSAPVTPRNVADAGADRSTDAAPVMPAAVEDRGAAPAPPPAAAAVASPEAAAESADTSQVRSREALTQAPERRHSYTNSARAGSAAMTESRALRQAKAEDVRRELGTTATAASVPGADGLTSDDPPSRWYAEIRRLRDAGDIDAARAVLDRFHDVHPTQALPDDLRALLPEPPSEP